MRDARCSESFQLIWETLTQSALTAMAGYLLLLLTAFGTASAATSEDEARAVIERFTSAMRAKDADAVSHLLTSDCTI
jgi:hypothetical protein